MRTGTVKKERMDEKIKQKRNAFKKKSGKNYLDR